MKAAAEAPLPLLLLLPLLPLPARPRRRRRAGCRSGRGGALRLPLPAAGCAGCRRCGAEGREEVRRRVYRSLMFPRGDRSAGCAAEAMLLFVGLGNPGAKLRRQPPQHRLHGGAMRSPSATASRRGAAASRAWRRKARSAARRVLLLLPGTYHERVRARGRRRPCISTSSTLADIVVFHDEIELPPGKVRVKTGGGIAGHNGLRSITAHIGNDYRRVRIGVGHPGVKELVHALRAQRFRQETSGHGSRRCATSSPTTPSCWSRARTRASRTRCISPWPPRASATTTSRRRSNVTTRHIAWDSNAASSACRMSASRRSSMR